MIHLLKGLLAGQIEFHVHACLSLVLGVGTPCMLLTSLRSSHQTSDLAEWSGQGGGRAYTIHAYKVMSQVDALML